MADIKLYNIPLDELIGYYNTDNIYIKNVWYSHFY